MSEMFGRYHLEGLSTPWKPVYRSLKPECAMFLFLSVLCDSPGSSGRFANDKWERPNISLISAIDSDNSQLMPCVKMIGRFVPKGVLRHIKCACLLSPTS